MKRTKFTLLPLVAVLLATAAWSISSHARATAQEEIAEPESCRAELSPDQVSAAAGALTISVIFSREAGEIIAVASEQTSGIEIVDFAASDDPLAAFTAELDVAAAEVGTWWLEFEGEETTCRALFTVSEPTPRRS